MDRIQIMWMFVRVAEAGSFVRAAETLSLPTSTVTSTIKNLEKYLKIRLLNRTARRVSLTSEGLQYLAQRREILALIEHSESNLSESVARPQRCLRVDMPVGIAHFVVMSHLPDFYRHYPDIYLMIGVSDWQVDLIQENVSCVIHMGKLNNSSLMARPLGRFHRVTCASPYYLRGYDIPSSPEALSKYRTVHYFSGQTRQTDEFRFIRHEETFSVPVSDNAAVNEAGLYIEMCLAGFGLAQLAGNIVADHLQEGGLVEVLTDWQPPPVSVTLLHPHQHPLSPAVRAFAEWVSEAVWGRYYLHLALHDGTQSSSKNIRSADESLDILQCLVFFVNRKKYA